VEGCEGWVEEIVGGFLVVEVSGGHDSGDEVLGAGESVVILEVSQVRVRPWVVCRGVWSSWAGMVAPGIESIGYTIGMVKLTKIYTRTGDSGTTGLGSGERVGKSSIRVEAYGGVDETNAAVGVAILYAEGAMKGLLESIQHDLFDVGADLCMPIKEGEDAGMVLRVTQGQVDRLEEGIDVWNKDLGSLTSFVLPGGTALSCHLHVARTVCRRAERDVAGLIEVEGERTNGLVMVYLNRLSDLLFVLGRAGNVGGKGDVLWVAGKNRD